MTASSGSSPTAKVQTGVESNNSLWDQRRRSERQSEGVAVEERRRLEAEVEPTVPRGVEHTERSDEGGTNGTRPTVTVRRHAALCAKRRDVRVSRRDDVMM